jgi:hypothetical protein
MVVVMTIATWPPMKQAFKDALQMRAQMRRRAWWN